MPLKQRYGKPPVPLRRELLITPTTIMEEVRAKSKSDAAFVKDMMGEYYAKKNLRFEKPKQTMKEAARQRGVKVDIPLPKTPRGKKPRPLPRTMKKRKAPARITRAAGKRRKTRRKRKRKRTRRKRKRKRRRKSKRRRRGGLMAPEEESFEKAYVGPKEYGSLGTPTCYGPSDCTSDRAKQSQGMCLSFGYNPTTGNSDCKWGMPPASVPIVAPIKQKYKDNCVHANPAKRGETDLCTTKNHNKKRCLRRKCKWIGDKSNVTVAPACADDMTFVFSGNKKGIPLCQNIKNRKAKMAAEQNPTKKAQMKAVIDKQCNKLGYTYCKKTCGVCPSKAKGGRRKTKRRRKRKRRRKSKRRR